MSYIKTILERCRLDEISGKLAGFVAQQRNLDKDSAFKQWQNAISAKGSRFTIPQTVELEKRYRVANAKANNTLNNVPKTIYRGVNDLHKTPWRDTVWKWDCHNAKVKRPSNHSV